MTEQETTEKDATTTEQKKEISTKPTPPLEAAARRLERLLGGTTASPVSKSDSTVILSQHTNPSKIVKRWLGTSSGTAAKATLVDVSSAASVLLDPLGPCAT
eukprot:4569861-Ditylum_brightwellii.AAC.1